MPLRGQFFNIPICTFLDDRDFLRREVPDSCCSGIHVYLNYFFKFKTMIWEEGKKSMKSSWGREWGEVFCGEVEAVPEVSFADVAAEYGEDEGLFGEEELLGSLWGSMALELGEG